MLPGVHKFILRQVARYLQKGLARKTKLFFGRELEIVLPEVTSEAIYTYGVFDEIVSWLAIRNIEKGDTVFDIGAHYGYFTMLFAHLVGEQGKVFAFEPTPTSFEILSRNVAHATNVTAINAAAGDTPGRAEMQDYGLTYSAFNSLSPKPRLHSISTTYPHRITSVEVLRIDDYVESNHLRPTFIKIDAENFEEKVVLGMAGTIEIHRPTIVLESGGSEASVKAGSTLLSRGYQAVVCDGIGAAYRWCGDLTEASRRYKDILYVPNEGEVVDHNINKNMCLYLGGA
jgi:FkbM family methyltransferase